MFDSFYFARALKAHSFIKPERFRENSNSVALIELLNGWKKQYFGILLPKLF
jgi:hypothetical protein